MFLFKKELEKLLNNVYNHLYCGIKLDAQQFMALLKPKNEREVLYYFIIISVVSKLEISNKKNALLMIHSEIDDFIQNYCFANERSATCIDLAEAKAEHGLVQFYWNMDRLRDAYDRDKYSMQGIKFSLQLYKLRPVTTEEINQIINDNDKKIEVTSYSTKMLPVLDKHNNLSSG